MIAKKPHKFGRHNKITMTLAVYRALNDAYDGICLACGSYQSGTEPDARKYVCEDCDERQIYGTEELFMMDLITLVEPTETSNFNY